MVEPDSGEKNDLESAILLALAKTRSGAMPFPAHFSGLTFDNAEAGKRTLRLPAQPQVLRASGEFAAMAILMACDLSLSSAIRLRVGKEVRLPTVSLQIDYSAKPMSNEMLLLSSTLQSQIGDLVTAECEIKARSGERVGRGLGRFLLTARQPGEGFSRFPWETGSPIALNPSELTPAEHEIYSFLLRKDLKVKERRLYDQIYRVAATSCGEAGTTQLRQPLGPHLANRSGIVQGGAIAGLLSDACEAAARETDASLAIWSTSCTFLRPASLGSRHLTANARVLFIGRRITCASAEATDDHGNLLARAEALLVPQAA